MTESTRSAQRQKSVIKVLHALNDFFAEKRHPDVAPVYASTRDIANRSELSIYNARHILIKLEKEGMITSVKREKQKSLYWNKTEKLISL